MCIIIIIIIIINLTYIALFDTNGILTALYIVITYIQKTNKQTNKKPTKQKQKPKFAM